MRMLAIVMAGVVSAGALPVSAQQYGPQPDEVTKREILGIREAAWRAWFANDRAGFERIVPAELVALGWDGGPWDDRARTVTQMGEFAKSGRKVTALEFPRNVWQRYGDVVILYTSYRIVLTGRAGQPEETSGRGTEVFVRRGGRWVHTGWHLDTVGR
ncbi:MAG TPA: nuclear transport factor 2 family protein [Gemmatimonadales bacterium]|nr:nuclear transport factor 2 family protein [Gemmatimonadales bacterium]